MNVVTVAASIVAVLFFGIGVVGHVAGERYGWATMSAVGLTAWVVVLVLAVVR